MVKSEIEVAFEAEFEKESNISKIKSILSQAANKAGNTAKVVGNKVDSIAKTVGRKEIDFFSNRSDKIKDLLENQDKLDKENLERLFGYGTSILIPGI